MIKNRITYDEVSPLTGNLCVLLDKDESTGIVSKLCMDSGYTTNTLLIDSPEFWDSLRSNFLIGYIFAFKAEDGSIWIPSAHSTDLAALYPIQEFENEQEGTTKLVWQVSPFDISFKEGSEDPTIELKWDESKSFEKLEFLKAFDLFTSLSNTQN